MIRRETLTGYSTTVVVYADEHTGAAVDALRVDGLETTRWRIARAPGGMVLAVKYDPPHRPGVPALTIGPLATERDVLNRLCEPLADPDDEPAPAPRPGRDPEIARRPARTGART